VHLAACTTRMAVQLLDTHGYSKLDHDWVVLNFRPGSTPVAQGSFSIDPACPLAVH
jgi:hypothetical protein